MYIYREEAVLLKKNRRKWAKDEFSLWFILYLHAFNRWTLTAFVVFNLMSYFHFSLIIRPTKTCFLFCSQFTIATRYYHVVKHIFWPSPNANNHKTNDSKTIPKSCHPSEGKFVCIMNPGFRQTLFYTKI